MTDPEKITSLIQIQLGTMQFPTLPYLPLSLALYPGNQNGLQDLSPTPHPTRCVPITYHMHLPFVYEGPAVAVLYFICTHQREEREAVDHVWTDL